MSNPFGVLEITVKEVDARRKAGDKLLLVDVREAAELMRASIPGEDVIAMPMSELAKKQLEAIPEALQDKSQEVIVVCHHGNRSMQVAAWLHHYGWEKVYNMTGGVEAWAIEVDSSIGRYMG